MAVSAVKEDVNHFMQIAITKFNLELGLGAICRAVDDKRNIASDIEGVSGGVQGFNVVLVALLQVLPRVCDWIFN